jgi:hypothetical protein
MKTLIVLIVLAAAGYFGWQRYQERRETAADVVWEAGQVGREIDDSFLIFDAKPLDGRLLQVEGAAGAIVTVMTGRMGYHFHKIYPASMVGCIKPEAREMISALSGMILVSDNPRGRRQLDEMVATYRERARQQSKRPCLKLQGNELNDPRVQFSGGPTSFVRVTQFEMLDCGDLIAGM